MTAQEQQMLAGLTERINKTQLADKDPDAEQMLQQSLGSNPDALYILAQTVLVQQYALDQAQKQLADARAQVQQMRQQTPPPQPRHATSFLGNLLGLKEDDPAPPPAPPQYAQQPQYVPVPNYPMTQSYPQQAYGAPGGFSPMPQQGGFLRSAMQTATGVAAGALAFEGIESLMHGFGHEGGYGSGFGGSGGFGEGGRPEVINNYYGDSSPAGDHAGQHGEHLSPDIEDRRGDASAFSNAFDGNDRESLGNVDNSGGESVSYGSPDQDTTDDADTSSGFNSDSGGGFDGSDSGGDFGGSDNS